MIVYTDYTRTYRLGCIFTNSGFSQNFNLTQWPPNLDISCTKPNPQHHKICSFWPIIGGVCDPWKRAMLPLTHLVRRVQPSKEKLILMNREQERARPPVSASASRCEDSSSKGPVVNRMFALTCTPVKQQMASLPIPKVVFRISFALKTVIKIAEIRRRIYFE